MSELKCFEYDEISLKKHQKITTDFLRKQSNHGLIAFYGTGTGKSITALATARCLKLPTIFILPPAVIGGFEREINRIEEFKSLNIELYSYGKFLNKYDQIGNRMVKGKFLVLDEAHNFRNVGHESLAMIAAFSNSEKCLLLTGTPLQNDPYDMLVLLCMVGGDNLKNVLDAKKYYADEYIKFNIALQKFEIENSANDLGKYLYNKTVYYSVNLDTNSKFPSVKEKYIYVPMSKSYQKEYEIVEDGKKRDLPSDMKNINLAVFYNGLRRATNKVKAESPKIIEIMKVIKHHLAKKQKIIVYSTWQDAGIGIIKDRLCSLHIDAAIVSGEESQTSKSKAVKDFNEEKMPVILITKAGAAGIDLKRARVVIIMEPHWNDELIKQVIGRAARYESHSQLPESQRNVIVYRFILQGNDKLSIDEIIDNMAKEKNIRNYNFYKIVKKNRYRTL